MRITSNIYSYNNPFSNYFCNGTRVRTAYKIRTNVTVTIIRSSGGGGGMCVRARLRGRDKRRGASRGPPVFCALFRCCARVQQFSVRCGVGATNVVRVSHSRLVEPVVRARWWWCVRQRLIIIFFYSSCVFVWFLCLRKIFRRPRTRSPCAPVPNTVWFRVFRFVFLVAARERHKNPSAGSGRNTTRGPKLSVGPAAVHPHRT